MIDRFRSWLADILRRFEPEPAAGIFVRDPFVIDDGVDYSLPLVVPDWVTPEQKTQLVAAAVKEAGSIYHNQFDRPYLYAENLSQFPTADPLAEWDFQVRKDILSRTHLAFERNPLANTAVALTTMFSVGEGMTVSYYNDQVEEILEEFRTNKENAVQEYEKSFLNDLQVDGELFIRFHVEPEDGRTVIVPIRPWEIDWIKTERGFNKRVVAYHFRTQQSDGTPGDQEWIDQEIPADEVLHVTINKHSSETRGRPELFRILPWLKAYKDWLEGRARQNHWRGGLLWDVTLAGALPNQVAAKRNQYKQPPPPGSLVIHNDKETWAPMVNAVGGADVAEDGREIKLMSILGMRLPEYMLGDGENANLASAKAQQLPALRKFTDFQDILISQVWEPIYKRVLENAIEAGILPEEVDEMDADGDLVYEEPEEEEVTIPEPAMAYEAGELQITLDPSVATNGKQPALAYNGNGNPTVPMGSGDGNVPPPVPPPPPPKPEPKIAKKIKACEAFDVSAPELEEDDPATLATALQTAVNADWVSNETASGQMGFDYAVEQKKIKREKQESSKNAYQGMGNLPLDPNAPDLADFGKQPPEEQPMPPNGKVNGAIPPQFLKQSETPLPDEKIDDVVGRMLDHHKETVRAEVVEQEFMQMSARAEREYHEVRNDLITGLQQTKAVAENMGRLTDKVDRLSDEIKEVSAPIVIPPQLPAVTVDDATVYRIARAAAREVSQTLSVIESVLERDEGGKPLRSIETHADGRTETYQFEYDAEGRLSGKRRIG